MEQKMAKKKKKRKKRIVIGAVCFCLLTAAGGVLFWQKQEADASESEIVIVAGVMEAERSMEEVIYARIDSIVGNDLELSLAEQTAEDSGEKESGPDGAARKEESGMPEAGGQSPDFGQDSMAAGNRPAGFPEGMGGAMNATAYTLTGETKSLEVPVGTEVITKLGVVTTFSRLSSGNIIAVLLEEGTDNILKIWIVS